MSMTDTGPRWVVGSDGSEGADRAIEWCLAHAPGRAASVHVLRAWQLPAIAGVEFGVAVDGYAPEEAHENLDQLAAQARSAGIEVTAAVEYGAAAALLLTETDTADLLVIGTRGHGGFRRLVLGSVSSQCATHARRPVIVVPPADVPSDGTVDRLVVGVDGSEASKSALRWAANFARGDAPVSAVGAWVMSPWAVEADERQMEELWQHAQTYFNEAVDEVEKALGTPSLFEREFLHARPTEALAERCGAGRIIVVGERGHHGLGGALLGSVATGVLHHATCPVAVIPIGDGQADG